MGEVPAPDAWQGHSLKLVTAATMLADKKADQTEALLAATVPAGRARAEYSKESWRTRIAGRVGEVVARVVTPKGVSAVFGITALIGVGAGVGMDTQVDRPSTQLHISAGPFETTLATPSAGSAKNISSYANAGDTSKTTPPHRATKPSPSISVATITAPPSPQASTAPTVLPTATGSPETSASPTPVATGAESASPSPSASDPTIQSTGQASPTASTTGQ